MEGYKTLDGEFNWSLVALSYGPMLKAKRHWNFSLIFILFFFFLMLKIFRVSLVLSTSITYQNSCVYKIKAGFWLLIKIPHGDPFLMI